VPTGAIVVGTSPFSRKLVNSMMGVLSARASSTRLRGVSRSPG
jgi:hypothetical protein